MITCQEGIHERMAKTSARWLQRIDQVKDILGIGDDRLLILREIQEKFPMFINPYYLSLIDLSDPDDPIRKMSIPDVAEASSLGSFDTSGEHSNTVLPGLQH